MWPEIVEENLFFLEKCTANVRSSFGFLFNLAVNQSRLFVDIGVACCANFWCLDQKAFITSIVPTNEKERVVVAT